MSGGKHVLQYLMMDKLMSETSVLVQVAAGEKPGGKKEQLCTQTLQSCVYSPTYLETIEVGRCSG